MSCLRSGLNRYALIAFCLPTAYGEVSTLPPQRVGGKRRLCQRQDCAGKLKLSEGANEPPADKSERTDHLHNQAVRVTAPSNLAVAVVGGGRAVRRLLAGTLRRLLSARHTRQFLPKKHSFLIDYEGLQRLFALFFALFVDLVDKVIKGFYRTNVRFRYLLSLLVTDECLQLGYLIEYGFCTFGYDIEA
jgi:hypothetical protein